MIHYSSIKDAWGKKDMFKNNSQNAKFTNIYDPSTNCQASIKQPYTTIQNPPVQNPPVQNPPETFSQIEPIKYDLQTNHKVIQNEHFAQNNCAFMEHLQNCPFCMGKMKEHFADPTSTGALGVYMEQPISSINLFGFEINITKDVLKVLFIIILIVIFILLLRMVNVSFKKENTQNADLVKLVAQMKYISPMISQL